MLYAIMTTREVKGRETIGKFQLFKEDKELFSCVTLELPWRDNEPFKSCVPGGGYVVAHRYSDTYGEHFILRDVEGREWILIHAGNFYTNTEGCLLIGKRFVDIDNDGLMDITNSRETLDKLVDIVPKGESFRLRINRV